MLRSFAWAVMACMLALYGAPNTASACSPPSNWIELPDVPANGVVRFALHCEVSDCFEAGDIQNLGVTDTTTGAAVAGEVIVREEQAGSKLSLAWKPNAPLVEGRTYAIDWRPT